MSFVDRIICAIVWGTCSLCIACAPEDDSSGSSAEDISANMANAAFHNESLDPLWTFNLETNPIQGFYCTAQGAPFGQLIFDDQGGIEVRPEEGLPFRGTYQISGDGWLIESPSAGFSETTMLIEPKLGIVGRFSTPTLSCHAIGWGIDRPLSGRYQCPPIKYIEGVSYEDNLFEFGPYGDVFRSNRTERLAGNGDTLFDRTHGIYRIDNDRVYMYFGDRSTERELSGSFTEGAWVVIDQLDPSAGQCTLTD